LIRGQLFGLIELVQVGRVLALTTSAADIDRKKTEKRSSKKLISITSRVAPNVVRLHALVLI
jgi:hypothetical protein